MLTKKDYCDYTTCVALKELGFIGQGRCYYDLDKEPNKLRHFGIQVLTTRSAKALNFVLAVHLYDAQKWLREEKGIIVYPVSIGDLQHQKWYAKIEYMDFYSYPIHDTYEDALVEGLREAVKILKEE